MGVPSVDAGNVQCVDHDACDDGDDCTEDHCEFKTGVCVNTPPATGLERDCACPGEIEVCTEGAWSGCSSTCSQTFILESGDDDGYVDSYGVHMHLGYMSLYSDRAWAALRFVLSDLPPGAQIIEAELEVYIDSDDSTAVEEQPEGEDDPRLSIWIEDSANPMPLSDAPGDIPGRALSQMSVHWSEDDIGMAWQRSPDLAPLIQYAMELPGWGDGAEAPSIIFLMNQQVPPTAGSPSIEFHQMEHPSPAPYSGAYLHLQYRP